MPKSKRNRVVHMTQVAKKTREHKDKLFENIREVVPNYQHVFIISVENMRNTHIQQVRQELSDSRIRKKEKTILTCLSSQHLPRQNHPHGSRAGQDARGGHRGQH
ncbi:hypothetical protein G7054_g3713 [Neopestalotiopsis clavispora]|nr:hypothetical protein G7054_g3713 [Neopestalotiopsis clavispora]